jgi:hypothetical protein
MTSKRQTNAKERNRTKSFKFFDDNADKIKKAPEVVTGSQTAGGHVVDEITLLPTSR